MSTSSERVMGNALALAWSLWAELGVSGWQRSHPSHAIDPERLILFTASLGDTDPRLLDEATDWCAAYGRYVSAARLRNLLALQTAEVRDAFGEMAATVNSHSSSRWPGQTQARSFQRTRRSAVADFSGPSLVVLRLRALFGVGARAEILRAFLADPSARLSAADAAAEGGYTKRNTAEALEALRMAGLLDVQVVRNQRRYGLVDAAWLTALPGSLPRCYPRWSSVFRILEGFIAGLRRAEALTTRARAVEASDVLHELSGDLAQVGVRVSTLGSRPDRGPSRDRKLSPDAWTTLEKLAVDLSQKWASGSLAGVEQRIPR